MDIKASQRLITLREMSLEAQLQLFRLPVVLLLQGFPDGLQGLCSRAREPHHLQVRMFRPPVRLSGP